VYVTDEDWKSYYEQLVESANNGEITSEMDDNDKYVWCNRWNRQIDYRERFKYNSDTYWNVGGDMKDSEWMKKWRKNTSEGNLGGRMDEKPEINRRYELNKAS